MNPATTERKTAGERREAVLDAALTAFGDHGFEGASTDAIARAAGISQPYLFRLFGTKKELFVAGVSRCFDQTLDAFAAAADGLHGEEAMHAMGEAYHALIAENPDLLRAQMQSYAACDDDDVCAAVRAGYRRLIELVESTGAAPEDVRSFFASGMLINVVTMMGLDRRPEAWGERLLKA